MVLRCTAKALAFVGSLELGESAPGDDDWYVNLLWFERRKCLLFLHSGTLFPVFVADVRKPDVRNLGEYAVTLIEEEMKREDVAPSILGPLDPSALQVAKTASRQILGFLNENARVVDYAVYSSGGLARLDVESLNRDLRRQLHNRDGYATPLELVARREAAA